MTEEKNDNWKVLVALSSLGLCGEFIHNNFGVILVIIIIGLTIVEELEDK